MKPNLYKNTSIDFNIDIIIDTISSDASITRTYVRINEKSVKGVLDTVYKHLEICASQNRKPITKLLYASLLHDVFPSLSSKRIRTEHGSKASKYELY